MHSPETLEALNKAYKANDNTIERKLALERKPTHLRHALHAGGRHQTRVLGAGARGAGPVLAGNSKMPPGAQGSSTRTVRVLEIDAGGWLRRFLAHPYTTHAGEKIIRCREISMKFRPLHDRVVVKRIEE